MDRFNIASLTLKIIAIYIVFVLIENISTLVGILIPDSTETGSGISQLRHPMLIFLPMFLLLLIAVALFALNRTFSCMLIDRDESDLIEEHEGPPPGQAVAFSVVGLVIFATAVPGFLSTLLSIIAAGGRYRGEILSAQWPELLSGLLQTGLGAGLFFGARTLSEMWRRFTRSTRPIAREDAIDE